MLFNNVAHESKLLSDAKTNCNDIDVQSRAVETCGARGGETGSALHSRKARVNSVGVGVWRILSEPGHEQVQL